MTDSSGLLSGGPIVVGLEPGLPPSIVAAAEQLGLAFDCEVLFAYVELNSAIVELDSARTRTASSLKPEMDEEMTGIAAELAGYQVIGRVLPARQVFVESTGRTALW